MSIIDGVEHVHRLFDTRNRYAVVYDAAQQSKRLAHKYHDQFSYSVALSWILSGQKPEWLTLVTRSSESVYQRTATRIESDYFELIDDNELTQAVHRSLAESRKAQLSNHEDLVYCYDAITDEFRKARVRILTRIIWYRIERELNRSDV